MSDISAQSSAAPPGGPLQIHTQHVWWIVVLLAAWSLSATAASTRAYYVMHYGCSTVLAPWLEPFAVAPAALLVSVGIAATWFLWSVRRVNAWATTWLVASLLPLVLWVLRLADVWPSGPAFWEAIWFAGFTGLSFGVLASREPTDGATWAATKWGKWHSWSLPIAVLICFTWWVNQSWVYYHSFLLGFNDYGHFLQRVVNTLAGRGVLMETPVLPAFWDHFNPGLLLMAPAWSVYPDVGQAFVWQALSLAGSGWLILAIARRLGHSMSTATLFGIAWLAQPSVGQMNLAYTYGWHPITLAIPLLLGAQLNLLARRRTAAAVCVLLALSMEEGVFVIVCLTALVCGTSQVWQRYRANGLPHVAVEDRSTPTEYEFSDTLPATAWLMVAAVTGIGFVLVYKFSGLAEFQTGRFVSLGASLPEVIMSPVLRPYEFWGSFIKADRWYFVLLLWLPCGLPALIKGWRYLLPTLPPLALLLVWNHLPAHSLAFQYPATLLPLFWLAAMSGARSPSPALPDSLNTPAFPQSSSAHAVMALVTGLVLSMFVGQLPHSAPTLLDVEGQTFGMGADLRRSADADDGRWLLDKLQSIKSDQATFLTTGRIAAHLVGAKDIETVGQFIERRQRLEQLPDRLGQAILSYDWIVLDRRESFQQAIEQTQAIEAEARRIGFMPVDDQFDVVVLQRGR